MLDNLTGVNRVVRAASPKKIIPRRSVLGGSTVPAGREMFDALQGRKGE